jgi:peroxiredoxin
VTALALLLVAWMAGVSAASAPPAGLTGLPAPDFELATASGERLRLSSLRGRPVLLNFWATWCHGCQAEIPWLVDIYRRHSGRLAIVGVSMDDPGSRGIADFARARGVTYPMLLGGQDIARSYGGVQLLPQTFLIDSRGRIVRVLAGIESREALEAQVSDLLRRDVSL